MFLETIKSEGLAHLSYLVGSGHDAAVIDPRRDCDIYIELAHRHGARIRHIFETHRNEDYIVGSRELAERTGATIHHGKELPFGYGHGVSDGDVFEVGSLRLKVLHTPGHTDESISLALHDTSTGEDALGVFTGDALFVGDVGRTDFFPERKEEVAALLFDSLHEKILPLGDQAILYPAHGKGSVCGSGMAARDVSTLGYEKMNNPRLQMKRDAFIQFKVNEKHTTPPYFHRMEDYNLEGPPILHGVPVPPPLSTRDFVDAINDEYQLVDIRSPEAFAGAFIPGSLSLPVDMIPAYAGWFLTYDRPILLVAPGKDLDAIKEAATHLYRIGYDNIAGFLAGGLHAWEVAGREFDAIPALFAGDLKQRLERDEPLTLLDVRKAEEWEKGHLPEATFAFLGDLPQHLDRVPRDRPVAAFCGSGRRAIIAASILKQTGYEHVENVFGSMKACKRIGCDLEKGEAA